MVPVSERNSRDCPAGSPAQGGPDAWIAALLPDLRERRHATVQPVPCFNNLGRDRNRRAGAGRVGADKMVLTERLPDTAGTFDTDRQPDCSHASRERST